jgi:aspartyl-tRNA(Asn)/glutamyl-tRNA(Gln) amidotransferase subunit A
LYIDVLFLLVALVSENQNLVDGVRVMMEHGNAFLEYQGRGSSVRFAWMNDLKTEQPEFLVPPQWDPSVRKRSDNEGDLPFLTIREAADRIKARDCSPVELTVALLERIERLNPLLNAYITVTSELALKQAREAQAEIEQGRYRGPLHGIPLCLKDLVATEGVLTTGGTGAFSDWVPREDATVWARLREAGAILLGKTGLHEMAAGFTNYNPFYGATRNPWNPYRITGGSSGGSAAAVAGNLCLGSIGSDTAGSIRVPASFCGLTGLKPTFGRVSTFGTLYLSWTRDHLGPMAKTAEDAAILLGAIAGYDAKTPFSAMVPSEDFVGAISQGLQGVRLLVPTNYFWDFDRNSDGEGTGLDLEVKRSVEAAIDVLRELGATITRKELPSFGEGANLANPAERAFFLAQMTPERKERFSMQYRHGLEWGAKMTAVDHMQYIEKASEVRNVLEKALQGYDAMIMPTAPIVAPYVDTVREEFLQAEAAFETAIELNEPPPARAGSMSAVGRYTSPFNLSGQPALSVPCGINDNGVPIGMMIAGNRFADAMVLRVGHAFQSATTWHKRVPNLNG